LRAWIARAAREWPLWIAIAGILSLLWLPRIVRFGSVGGSAERRELAALRVELDSGDLAAAEARIAAFLARHPADEEAQLMLAQATLARARKGSFPGVASMTRAWTLLSKAPRTPETNVLRRDAGALMAEYGMLREAVARLGELHKETPDADLALDLVPALVKLAALEPDFRHARLDEASTRLSEFLHVAPPDRRVKGLLVRALLYRETQREEELLQSLASDLAEQKNPADRGLLQMERGRTFSRQGRNMEAMACFDEAEKLLVDPLAKGVAMVQQAILFARAGNRECVEVCNRVVAAESPAAPLALVVSGVFELPARPLVALDALRNGFSQIRRPRLLDEIEFSWAYDEIQKAAAHETEPDRLARFAAVDAELARLQPLSSRLAFDHAAVLLRARRFEDAANRLLSLENSERALLEAADACAAGGLHLRAASLYRAYVDLQPGANSAGLFHRAASLKNAGDVSGAMAGFEDYLAKAGPSGKFAGRALLEKAALQPAEEALATLDRILKARDVTTSPAQDDWAKALLARGRALTRLLRNAEARKSLMEYLERYGEGAAPRPASIEASWLLVQVAIQERQWKAGLTQLRDLDDRAARVAEADRAPYSELLKEARFVEGDLHLNLEDYKSAFQAYAEAVRRHADSEGRLWGLIGRATALARLERKEEARKDYSNARALLDEEKALAGRGRDYWEIALEALAREVR